MPTNKIPKRTRSQKAAHWIEKHCVVPIGPRKGKYVKLTNEQRQLLADIYDHEDSPRPIPVTGEMGAYLALIHTVGREAPQGGTAATMPEITVDPWTLWAATSQDLQQYIERDGAGAIVCKPLGTRFPRRAA